MGKCKTSLKCSKMNTLQIFHLSYFNKVEYKPVEFADKKTKRKEFIIMIIEYSPNYNEQIKDLLVELQ